MKRSIRIYDPHQLSDIRHHLPAICNNLLSLQVPMNLPFMGKRKSQEQIQAEIAAAKPGTVVSDAVFTHDGVITFQGPPNEPPPVLYTGPVYEYKLADYTVLTVRKAFEALGNEGWMFIGVEASGKSVFYRPK